MNNHRPRINLRTTLYLALGIALALGATTNPVAAQTEPFSDEVLAMREAARQAGVPEHELPLETPEQSRINKAFRQPWEQKVVSPVRHVLATMARESAVNRGDGRDATRYSTATVAVDRHARLLVECKVENVEPFDAEYFRSIGGELVVRATGYGLLVAWIPATQLPTFADRSDVRLVRHIDPPYTDVGAVDSEGDAIHNADLARTVFGIDGSGQLVGVISDGVEHLADSQDSGDLPTAPQMTVPAGCTGADDEGTAMLEIVWDLAPGADLAFCTGNPGSAGMINAINTLAGLSGMTIITDDLPKPGEPLFEDGPIAQAKQAAVAAGIFYTASAGNRGDEHYQGEFNATASNVTIGTHTYAYPHDFGGGDYLQSITLVNCSTPTCTNTIYLQWAEPYGSAAVDLDLYILDVAGSVVLGSSTDSQSGSGDPAETATFSAGSGQAANILVDYVGDDDPPPVVFMDLRAFNIGFNEYLVPAGSINGASRQPEVYAAGAAHHSTPNTMRVFSSRGPIRQYFPAPMVERMKPDGTAVDGVTVTGAGCFGCGPGCPPVPVGGCSFGGTSAATPHVAGMAALLLESQPGLTTAEVANAFNSTAVDIEAIGPDNDSGYGRLDVFAAICSFDETPPDITCPEDVTVECQGDEGVPADQLTSFLDGAQADDDCTASPAITNDAPVFFPLGTTAVEFTAIDDLGNEDTCTAYATVEDTIPPDVTAPVPITLECNGPNGVLLDDPEIQAWLQLAAAEDSCFGEVPDVGNDAPPLFPFGCFPGTATTVTFDATDGAGNTGFAQSTVTVRDTTAPSITCSADVSSLWPVNHKWVDVGLTFTTADTCDADPPAIAISVTSDEYPADDGAGGPIHCPDAIIGDDGRVLLRAEASGSGDGRVYQINVAATDSCGNVGTCSATVGVPHDQSGSYPVDSGQAFDATECGPVAAALAVE